jgi:hypothetical protein
MTSSDDRGNNLFYNRIFKACLEIAQLADLSLDDTIEFARDLTNRVVTTTAAGSFTTSEGAEEKYLPQGLRAGSCKPPRTD